MNNRFMLAVGQKRGSDELLSQTVSNNGDLNYNNVDSKKLKTDNLPSKVVHLRNVPQDAGENEIIQLGLPFGKMTNLVFARNKYQALLEMSDVTTASDMVDYYSKEHNRPKLRNRTIYVQYSNHKELKTNESNTNANVQAVLQAAQQGASNMNESGNVLRVIVEHLLYPVTIDALKQIFGKYGSVLRIVTFNKNDTFQALIEFGDAFSSQSAKLKLNGQNIYNGCCTLRIDYSKLNILNVKFNNDKCRDFTNPTLPSDDRDMIPMDGILQGSGNGMQSLQNELGGKMNFNGYSRNSMMSNNMNMMNSLNMMSNMNNMNMNNMNSMNLNNMSSMNMNDMNSMSMTNNMSNPSQRNPVLLVTNLNEHEATPNSLFTLFGVYGDVQRVKILFNKKDNALIQFTDDAQAQTALNFLDKVKVWGRQLKIYASKNNSVSMPKEGQPHNDLTKDYSTSSLHRFRNPNSKNYQNIYPPSPTLHLSNIPENIGDDDLKELFNEYGTVVAFRFFQKDRKMALVEMSSVEESIDALINLHNYDFGEKLNLRVSFTKSTIKG